MTTWYSQFIGLFIIAIGSSLLLYIFLSTIVDLLSEIRNIIRVNRYQRGENNAKH
jgi:hypothetical protein